MERGSVWDNTKGTRQCSTGRDHRVVWQLPHSHWCGWPHITVECNGSWSRTPPSRLHHDMPYPLVLSWHSVAHLSLSPWTCSYFSMCTIWLQWCLSLLLQYFVKGVLAWSTVSKAFSKCRHILSDWPLTKHQNGQFGFGLQWNSLKDNNTKW